jgi:hypothetical protein
MEKWRAMCRMNVGMKIREKKWQCEVAMDEQ